MNPREKDWQYWLGWYVAYGMAAILFIIVVLNSNFLRGLACSPDDKNCIRDWISALGGWAAVAAAAPTVFFLVKQIRTADAHQRENVIMQMMDRIVLVDGVIGVADAALVSARNAESLGSGIRNGKAFAHRGIRKTIMDEIEAFTPKSKTLLDFEAMIAPQLEQKRERLQSAVQNLHENILDFLDFSEEEQQNPFDIPDRYEFVFSDIEIAVRHAKIYYEAVKETASAFASTWNRGHA